MVARLQQLIVFGWLIASTCWIAFWWRSAPAVAIGGLFVLTCAHSAVLAIEFIASRRVSASDVRPRATAGHCGKAWWAETRIALQVFCWLQPFRSGAVPDELPSRHRRGVVLIHGFLCNRGFWNPWLHSLRADERAFVAVNLEPPLGAIDAFVQTIDEAVERVASVTGQPPLMICHSMGGLAVRAWLREHDGARVHRIVTLGTPHAGTWLARFGHTANGKQMRIGAEWLSRIDGDHASAHRTAFTCWYSDCDNVVFPISTATLPGADNRLASGRGHVDMAFDPRVRRETLALLDSD
ncbi:esterase/lipase family protein [Variovorax sp. PAMC 28711]|uniref:esterase/lipase family protein n=1 Tax=Variovorax sp. PAMC 28711 TaxID=1795631 RepID=UPI00078E536F|nr:alpha/beta fold hydrolase [Variovorax sp. PAMC 28711]AMM25194.1 permease [Variovorax sp. PAMC 28711]